jgi:hypothetical protein
MAEIAFQVPKAYAQTGKDYRSFLVIVHFGREIFLKGIAAHPREERPMHAF